MSLDEELQHALDALGERMRGQIDAEVQARVDEVRAEMAALREEAEAELAAMARAQQDEIREEAEQAKAQLTETAAQLQAAYTRMQALEVALEAAQTASGGAESRALRAEASLQETEGRARDTEGKLQETEGRLQEAECRRQETEDKLREAAGKLQDAERRMQEAEGKRQAAESKLREAEGRQQEAESRALNAESRLQEIEHRQHKAEVKEAARHDGLAPAMRRIDEARSIHEILERLVDSARDVGGRVAVLLARGGRLEGFRFIGFEPAPDPPASIAVPIADGGVLAEAVIRGTTAQAGPEQPGNAPAFARGTARRCLAVPMLVGDQPVAVFYADADAAGPFRPEVLEILARHAGQRLAILTAFKAAHALSLPAAPAPPIARSDEDEEEAARRYARLLVSEIRLYHEADVAEGRERRDLGTRLASEIARARVLYEQRVPPDVRRRTDFFHAELVRTLADGDARLLETSS